MSTINVTSAPKTATFQMRINPEVKQRVEEIYARQGLSFTDAVNIFIQQSLNMEGLPFLASPENAEYMKAKAMRRLLDEAEMGVSIGAKTGYETDLRMLVVESYIALYRIETETVSVGRIINARQDYIRILLGEVTP
mgnify:CR=1 FL=1